MPRSILVLATAGVLAGCPSRDVSEVNPTQDKEEFKDIPVQLNRDLDLLFVIDDSGSMAEEQDNLTANLPVFINVLETIEGGLPNVHIGVVSSDLGAGPFNTPNCNGPGDNGALLVGDLSCQPTGANYIEDISDGAGGRITNYPGTLAEAFACNATLGSTGCGFEQHLESMRRALNGSNDENNGFLRETAFLGVVFLADEDDCSTMNTQMFDPAQNGIGTELGFFSSYRCNEFGVTCETGNENPRAFGTRTGCTPNDNSPYMYGVQEYVDFLRSLKEDDNLLVVAGIMGPNEPYIVGPDPLNAERPAIVPSCTNPTLETCFENADCSNAKSCVDGVCVSKADPSVRLTTFLQAFPNRNAYTTICNNDLSDGLALIAELLKEAIGNPCIEALLKDRNADTPELEYECTVSDVVYPGTDDQEETVLPFCNMAAAEDADPSDPPASTNLPCWHLIEDRTACPETPTGLTLIVERGDISVPIGTHVQARCVTCVDGNENLICDELE